MKCSSTLLLHYFIAYPEKVLEKEFNFSSPRCSSIRVGRSQSLEPMLCKTKRGRNGKCIYMEQTLLLSLWFNPNSVTSWRFHSYFCSLLRYVPGKQSLLGIFLVVISLEVAAFSSWVQTGRSRECKRLSYQLWEQGIRCRCWHKKVNNTQSGLWSHTSVKI